MMQSAELMATRLELNPSKLWFDITQYLILEIPTFLYILLGFSALGSALDGVKGGQTNTVDEAFGLNQVNPQERRKFGGATLLSEFVSILLLEFEWRICGMDHNHHYSAMPISS
jgi:hypothetical protein